MSEASQSGQTAEPSISPEQWALARRCLWVLGVLGSCSALGVAFSLYLVNNYPVLLIALSPLGRHLVLVAPSIDPTLFVVVAVLRRLAFYLACFQLGQALGPAGLDWLEARARYFASFVRWLERLFSRAGHLVVLVGAGPTVSGLAGISGMRLGVFVALASISLVARILLILGFADWLSEPIEWLLAWIEAHWVPGTILLASAVGVQQWRRIRLARKSAPGDLPT